MTQNARRLDAFGLDPASMLWTTQGRFYGPPTLLANLAMAHPCLLAARFLLSARPPDLIQLLYSMSQGRPPPRNRTPDDMDGPNPGSRPITVSDPQPSPAPRPWSATDIPSSSELKVVQNRLDMWPTYTRPLSASGLSFSTTSCKCSVALIVSS